MQILLNQECVPMSVVAEDTKKHTVEQKAENFFTQYIHRQAYLLTYRHVQKHHLRSILV